MAERGKVGRWNAVADLAAVAVHGCVVDRDCILGTRRGVSRSCS